MKAESGKINFLAYLAVMSIFFVLFIVSVTARKSNVLIQNRTEEDSWVSYVDGNGRNVIAYTGDLESIRRQVKDANATFLKVAYSRRVLDESNEALSALVGCYGIQSVETIYSRNIVVVTLTSPDEIEIIKRLIDCAAVEFEEEDSNFTLVATK